MPSTYSISLVSPRLLLECGRKEPTNPWQYFPMQCFCSNYFHCAAWLIFNHYSVWLSSLSGLSAFLWWPMVRHAAMLYVGLWWRAFLTGLNLTLLVPHIFPVSVSRPACPPALYSAAFDPLCSPSRPSFPHTLYSVTHSQAVCCSALVLPLVSVRGSCASCMSSCFNSLTYRMLIEGYSAILCKAATNYFAFSNESVSYFCDSSIQWKVPSLNYLFCPTYYLPANLYILLTNYQMNLFQSTIIIILALAVCYKFED